MSYSVCACVCKCLQTEEGERERVSTRARRLTTDTGYDQWCIWCSQRMPRAWHTPLVELQAEEHYALGLNSTAAQKERGKKKTGAKEMIEKDQWLGPL